MTTQARVVFSGDDKLSAVVRKVNGELEGFASKAGGLGRIAVGLGPVGVGIAAVGAAAGAAALQIFQFVGSVDDLDEAAQNLGLQEGAVALSEFRAAARESGVDSSTLDTALTRLNIRLSDAAAGGKESAAIFKAMGIDIRDAGGNLKSTDQVLTEVSNQFATYGNTAERAALATEIFGKSGARLVAYLSQGGDALRKNTGLTKEAVEESIKLQREFDALALSVERFKNSLLGSALPAINRFLERIDQIDGDKIRSKILPSLMLREYNRQMDEVIKKEKQRNDALQNHAANYSNEGRFTMKRAPVVPQGDDKKPKKDRAEELTDAQRALAQYVQGLERELTATQDLTEEQQVLNFLRSNPQADTTQTREMLLAMAAEVDGRRELVKQKKLDAEASEVVAAANKKQADEAKRLFDETRTPAEKLAKEIERLNEMLARGAIDWDTYHRALFNAQDDFDAATKGAKDAAKDLNDAAKDLGLTFASAFEDAIVGGKGFQEILKGIEQDILRIVTRKLVTEPFANFLTGALGGGGGGFLSGLFGGGGGGIPVFHSGTDYVPRTGLAMLQKGERVVPAEENRGGRGQSSSSTTINIDARGSGLGRRTTAQAAARMMSESAMLQARGVGV
jgi:hypothetical protein